MNISDNIRYIESTPALWQLYTCRRYSVLLQRGSSERVYNVPDKAGVVYNHLEDCFQQVSDNCYVVTGTAGEMWCVGAASLGKYDVTQEEITCEPLRVFTRLRGDVFAAVRIPADIRFTVEVDYGNRALLNGNSERSQHGGGDYVLVPAVKSEHGHLPDFTDSGRIINGLVFDNIYAPLLIE